MAELAVAFIRRAVTGSPGGKSGCCDPRFWSHVRTWDEDAASCGGDMELLAEAGVARLAVPNRKALTLEVSLTETSKFREWLKKVAMMAKDADFEWVIPSAWKKKEEEKEEEGE